MGNNRINRLAVLVTGLILLSTSAYGASVWPYRDQLEQDVRFWKIVFTQYNHNQYIFHDANNLRIIYKVVTFDTTVDERSRAEKEKHLRNEIKQGLLNLAKKPAEINAADSWEARLRKLYGDSAASEVYRQAAGQIRVQQGMRDKFAKGLERALAYLPFLKEVFREQGLPEELAYLPHIESSFNTAARSHVGASGMWQFMRSTARLYMKVNRIIDQRLDPLVSTRAAARLLKYNYKKTGDWALALTAYNYGLSGMIRAAKSNGPDYITVRNTFKHRRFQFASRNFYPEFLAVLEIMEDWQRLFPDIQPARFPAKIACQLKQPINLPRLARKLGLPLSDLKAINPVYTYRAWRGWVNIPSGYWINFPIETDLARIENYLENSLPELAEVKAQPEQADEVPAFSIAAASALPPEPRAEKTEAANSQDGFWPEFGKKPGVSSGHIATQPVLQYWEKQIMQHHPENMLSVENLQADIRKELQVKGKSIEVFANETLGHFADWLQIPTHRLRAINHLAYGRKIFQGQKLQLDFSYVSPREFLEKRFAYHQSILKSVLHDKQFVRYEEYEISRGESVWKLAQYRYKIPVDMIQYLNFHADINRLHPGDVLRIPVFQSNNIMEETL